MPSTEKLTVKRGATVEDQSFIFSSWLRSYRHAKRNANIPNHVYFPDQSRIIERILRKPTTSVTMLCNADDRSHIFGYVVFEREPPLLHWLYVKHAFRGMGFGRDLLNYAVGNVPRFTCSHMPANEGFYRTLRNKVIFNPGIVHDS